MEQCCRAWRQTQHQTTARGSCPEYIPGPCHSWSSSNHKRDPFLQAVPTTGVLFSMVPCRDSEHQPAGIELITQSQACQIPAWAALVLSSPLHSALMLVGPMTALPGWISKERNYRFLSLPAPSALALHSSCRASPEQTTHTGLKIAQTS